MLKKTVQETDIMFKPVKKKKVYEEIIAKIQTMIEDGTLRSGDQLPSERELEEAFRVSRSSVREALRSLEGQGLLVARQGNGTYVAQTPVEQLVQPMANAIHMEKDNQVELLEMRQILEPQLAYLAARRITPAEITDIESILDNQEKLVLKGDLGDDFDRNFHYAIAKAAKNKILLGIMDSVIDSLAKSRARYLQVAGRPKKSVYRHRQIIASIIAGDSEKAAMLMNDHLEDIQSVLVRGSL